MWIDPTRNLYVIFLTNRAYEPRVRQTLQEMRRIRAGLADEVLAAVPCPSVAGIEC